MERDERPAMKEHVSSDRLHSTKVESAASPQPALRPMIRVLYGIGEISNSIKSFTYGLFVLFFYTSVLGLPGTLVGLATSISLVWDAVIDPLIGYISDRVHSRFGRRHPFMFLGAILMGISFYMLFSPPSGLSTGALFAWLVATNFFLRTTNSVFVVPYQALGAELSQDYHERTSVTGTRAFFAFLGTLVAAALSFAVFFPDTIPDLDPKFNLSGYSQMGLAFGLAITFVGLITTLGTLSGTKRAQTKGTQGSNDGRLRFLPGLLTSLRNPSFLVLTASNAIFFLASVVNATLAVHYLTYYARITQSNALSLFQSSFYVGGLLGVVFWLGLARRFEKQHIYIGATLILALLMMAAYWLVGEGHLLGTGNVIPLVVGNGIAGFVASALWCIPASMVADIADEDELRTGQRREGTFFGINSFLVQDAASLAVLVSGILVDHFAKLVPGQVEQSAQTINRLAILYSLLPAILFLGTACLMLRYRLTRHQVESVHRKLAHRRAERLR